MNKEIIATELAPAAIGPYNQGVKTGQKLVFVSGQLPIDPKTKKLIKDDIEKATHVSIQNIKSILEASGSTLDQVVKTTVLLKSIDDFEKMNHIYSEYFTKDCPARVCFAVKELPLGADIEIEAIAMTD